MSNAFNGLARKVAREFFPEHVSIATSFDADWLREDTADHVEIRLTDRSGHEPLYGIARLDGRLLRSPQLEDAIRHELRHVAREMGYVGADKETR
jgi:hypothetical protein